MVGGNYATVHGANVIRMSIDAWGMREDLIKFVPKPYVTFDTVRGIDIVTFNRMLIEVFYTLEHIQSEEGFILASNIMYDECTIKSPFPVDRQHLNRILDNIFLHNHYYELNDNNDLILGWCSDLTAIILDIPT